MNFGCFFGHDWETSRYEVQRDEYRFKFRHYRHLKCQKCGMTASSLEESSDPSDNPYLHRLFNIRKGEKPTTGAASSGA